MREVNAVNEVNDTFLDIPSTRLSLLRLALVDEKYTVIKGVSNSDPTII